MFVALPLESCTKAKALGKIPFPRVECSSQLCKYKKVRKKAKLLGKRQRHSVSDDFVQLLETRDNSETAEAEILRKKKKTKTYSKKNNAF